MNQYSLFNSKWISGNYEPKASAYYYKTWVNYDMDLHEHDAVEIMYVLKGKCIVGFEDSRIYLSKGEFVVIDSGIAHKLIVEDNISCRMLNIEFKFVNKENKFFSFGEMVKSDVNLQSLINSKFQFLVLKDSEELFYTLKQLIMEYDNTSRSNSLVVQTLFYNLLIKISRLWNEDNKANNFSSIVYVKEAINYIHQHYDQEIKIEDIAEYVNVNSSYLQRLFKKNTNITIIEYLTKIRMEKAKMLLENTYISIIEICDYVGINSRQYFSYLFNKHFNVSPAQYRQSVKLENCYKNKMSE